MSNSSRKSSEKKILCWPSANCSTRPGSNSILVSFCSGCLCHNYEIYGRNTFGREMFCKSARRTNPLVGETRSHIRLWFRWLVGRANLLGKHVLSATSQNHPKSPHHFEINQMLLRFKCKSSEHLRVACNSHERKPPMI